MIDFDKFCSLADIGKCIEIDKAICFIWFLMRGASSRDAYFSEVIKLFDEAHLARPNVTRLRAKLYKDRRVLNKGKPDAPRFSLTRKVLLELDEQFKSAASLKPKPLTPLSEQLRAHSRKLTSPVVTRFIEEAIGCMEAGFHRAAVVLSWQGAMAILEAEIIRSYLQDFNREALRRQLIKKPIYNIDGMQKLKESDKLIVAESTGVISKSVKIALEECLSRRNNCSHPNDFEIGEGQVAGHVESLISHVFWRF